MNKLDFETGLFINNQYVDAKSGKTFKTVNPATEEVIAEVQEASAEDVNIAVDAAVEAFKTWQFTDGVYRKELINKLADLIDQHADKLAELESMDNGKPLKVARHVDVAMTAKQYRYFAAFADKITGETLPCEGGVFGYTWKEPIGVVGAIIPWNFPLVMQCWKLGPALAAGCTVVIKLSEKTPLSGLYMGKLFKEAGFPPGVVNIVNGWVATGEAIARHPKIDKIAFTGSSVVGHKIVQMSAESNLKKVTLELGGKSPLIVCKDADLDQAIETANLGLFFNMGQCCCASSRIYVEKPVYEEFVKKAVERAKKEKVGDPKSGETTQGAIVDKLQFDRVLSYIESGKKDAESGKCKLLLGGGRHGDKGYFVQPTIFGDVQDDQKIAKEEIFGPVMQILTFEDLDEVIERANNTIYGLAAAVCTRDVAKAVYVARRIKAGTVWVNSYNNLEQACPFGGYKQSGWGREKGQHPLDNYLETKCVTWPTTDFKK